MVGEKVQDGLTRQKPPTALEQRDTKGTIGEMIGEPPRQTVWSNKPIVDGVQFA
jgi:hypothetical protein